MMDRQAAYELLTKFVKNEALINHMLSVEAAMRFYARKFGQDEEEWAIAGLLHDYDWEIHPNSETHPLEGLPLLRELAVPETVVHAIGSHGDQPAYRRESLLDRALFACDELTGLITAVALVRPSRSLYDLEVSSVRKKWKDKSFAAGADREVIALGAAEFGIDLWEHVANVITAMREIAPILGLAGDAQS